MKISICKLKNLEKRKKNPYFSISISKEALNNSLNNKLNEKYSNYLNKIKSNI